jgi:hypothetical protein
MLQKLILAFSLCAILIILWFLSAPLLAPRLPTAPPEEIGLHWKECSLASPFGPWPTLNCFGHPTPIWEKSDPSKSARRIDWENFQLSIGQDNYWTNAKDWRFADRYTLYKNGRAVKSLFGTITGHSPNISLQNIAGQAAWEFADDDTNTIIYAGQDLRQLYGIDKAYRPYSLNGKLIFIAQKGDKYFVVYEGRRATPEFDSVIVAYCCEAVLYSVQAGQGKYLFSAKRNGQNLLVEITTSDLNNP